MVRRIAVLTIAVVMAAGYHAAPADPARNPQTDPTPAEPQAGVSDGAPASRDTREGETEDVPQDEAELDAIIQQILNEEVPDAVTDKQACLSTRKYRSIRIVDPHRIVFYGRRANSVWLNQLPNKCRGGELSAAMKSKLKVIIEYHAGKVCANNMLRLNHPAIGTSNCMLGTFSRVSPAQAELIIAELEGRPLKR